jgi:hypothetical protein
MASATLRQFSPYLLPIVWWKITSPIDVADASCRLDAAVRRLARFTFAGNRRVWGGVAFGSVRYSLVVLNYAWYFTRWNKEPHNPWSHDGQVIIRGRLHETPAGTYLWLVAFPGLQVSGVGVAILLTTGYQLLRFGDSIWRTPFSVVWAAWARGCLYFFLVVRELRRYVSHAFGTA